MTRLSPPIDAPRRPAVRRRATAVPVAVVPIAAFGLLALVVGCGGDSPFEGLPTADSEVEVTEYVTLPPPTTTTPPTTTIPPEPGSVLTAEATYVVVDGDYPFVVANRFGVDFKAFVELNGWTIVDGVVPEWPAPGTTIRIPAGATVPGGPSVLVPVPTTTVLGGLDAVPGSDPVTGSSAAPPTTEDDGVGCGTYTVGAGDYPTRVASKLDTTVDALAEANRDTDGYGAFYVGLVIAVPC